MPSEKPKVFVYVAEISVAGGKSHNRAAFTTPGAAWAWIGSQPQDPKKLASRAKVMHLELDPELPAA